ncbi:MAG: ABC transporter permease [Ilumatobacteraceae bacterium]
MTDVERDQAPPDAPDSGGPPVVADPVSAAATPSFTPPSAKREHWAAVVLPPLVLGVVVIGAWYAVSYGLLDARRRFLLKPPHEVVQNGFLNGDAFSEILDGLWSSAKVAFIGLAIAIVLGIAIAVLMSQTKLAERAVFPYMVALQAIPILALTPLISFWFGTGQTSRIMVCVIISIFPIILNTLFGLQSAERGMHDLFTLEHANRWIRLKKLMFPAALPAIFAGLRISAGLSVIGAIVGDFFFAQGAAGIGQLLRKYSSNLKGEELFTAVIMSSLLGVIVFLFFGWLQQRVIGKWSDPAGPHR